MIAVQMPSAKALAALAVAVALIGAGAWVHHRGMVSGRAEVQAALTKVQGELTTANTQVAVLLQKLDEQTASIEEARRKADEARDVAKASEAVADATKKDADDKASAWQKKLNEASKTPQCAVLSMPLCDEVSDY